MSRNKSKNAYNVNKDSHNIRNRKKQQEKNASFEAEPKKPINKKRLIIIILSSIALFAIIAGIAFGIWYSIYGRRFDYLSGDISKYITLSREDYVGYEINATVSEPTELDISERILKTLVKNKSKTAYEEGKAYFAPPFPIGAGWILNIWYRGYTLDENGNKIDFSGGCNYLSQKPENLEIGSGKFISGFEISLIGKNMQDYSEIKTVTTGTVESGDIVIVTMNTMFPDGTGEENVTKYIDLGDSNIEQVFGTGFREELIGAKIGDTFDQPFITSFDNGDAIFDSVTVKSVKRAVMTYTDGEYREGDIVTVQYTVTEPTKAPRTTSKGFMLSQSELDSGNSANGALRELFYELLGGGTVGEVKETSKTDANGTVYSNPTVTKVERRENKPITIDAHFPYDYSEESLRGKTVKFDVYVNDAVIYETPELDDSFITETLKLTPEELSEYEGTLTEKYREKIKSELFEEYREKLNAELEELAWQHLFDKVDFDRNKLPRGELRWFVNSYKDGFNEYYSAYKGSYETIEAAAMDYFGIKNGALWKDFVKDLSVQDIVTKMIFYHISIEEDFLPSGDELDTLLREKIDELLEDYLISKKCEREDYETEEEYLRAVSAYEKQMIEEHGGEAMILDALYYEIAMPKIVALATVVLP